MNMMELIRDMFRGTSKCPDTDYLKKRIETLSAELARCVGPIEIIEDHKSVISPYDVIKGYDMVVADRVYLAYSIEDWTALIARLHKNLGNKYEWTESVYDCDDIALLYASTLAYSAYRAGFTKQPAFGVAWSKSHAFNILIDSKDTVWLVEPQNGSILRKLTDRIYDMYDVQKIWFLS